jgi:hypothetical protein
MEGDEESYIVLSKENDQNNQLKMLIETKFIFRISVQSSELGSLRKS